MKMRLSIIETLLFCIIFCSCSHGQKAESRLVSGLYVGQAYFDCGKMKKMEMRSKDFSFELENKSEKEIIIHDVDVSCPCVVIDKAPDKIASGASEKVVGHIDIENQGGKLSKPIFVNFDNGEVMLLRIIGEVE